jgi:hypothetical protein
MQSATVSQRMVAVSADLTGRGRLVARCPLVGPWSSDPIKGAEATMVYAIFMLLVLLTLAAAWRGHALELPLFLVTVAWVLVHLVLDMTTPLTLSF